MSFRLETARLIVRPFEESDAEAWVEMLNDPDFRRYLPASPPATVELFLDRMAQRRAMERERGYAMWAVDLKDSGRLVGQCGLFPYEFKGPEIELAYHFEKASWGQGYATEAAKAVLSYALGSLDLDRVIAVVMPENIGSCRVLEKAGTEFKETTSAYGIPVVKKYVAERREWHAREIT